MKKNINTLEDALAFQLQGLYYAEKRLQEEFLNCGPRISSLRLQEEIRNYISSADNKLLKLERIFNYLMTEPLSRRNEVINTMIMETQDMMDLAATNTLRDLLLISCIQKINAYKATSYRTAYLLSVELEIDTATDLLSEIRKWEYETGKALADLFLEEFNHSQKEVR